MQMKLSPKTTCLERPIFLWAMGWSFKTDSTVIYVLWKGFSYYSITGLTMASFLYWHSTVTTDPLLSIFYCNFFFHIFCQKLVVLQDRWSVIADISQDRFHCMFITRQKFWKMPKKKKKSLETQWTTRQLVSVQRDGASQLVKKCPLYNTPGRHFWAIFTGTQKKPAITQ